MSVAEARASRWAVPIRLSALWVAFGACRALPVMLDDGWPCAIDADCVEDYVCREEICVSRASVECVADDDCRPSEDCAPRTRTCVASNGACSSDDTCAPRICDAETGRCVGCLAPDDCDPGLTCDLNNNSCVECAAGADCSTEVCDLNTNVCVECLSDLQCASPLSCDLRDKACVEGPPTCASDADCGDSLVCDPEAKVCVECLSNAECVVGQICNPDTRECEGCTDDSHCTSGQVCNVGTAACVDCNRDLDCPAGTICAVSLHECVGCTKDSQCVAGKTCDVQNLLCVDSEWAMPEWPFRKAITVRAGTVDADLVSFPLLVSLTDPDLAADAQDDGDDILFTDRQGAKLAHELQRFKGGNGTLIAWVSLPLLASTTDTTIFMYFGNAACEAQEDATGVWDPAYLGVWHLDEYVADGGYVSGVHKDATIYANHADQAGNASHAGIVGVAQDFASGTEDKEFIEITPLSASRARLVTMSCWFKSNDAGAIGDDWVAQRCVTQRRSSSEARLAFGINNNKLAVYWHDGSESIAQGRTAIGAEVWNHAAVVYYGSVIVLYLNGRQETAQIVGPLSDPYDSSDTPGRGGFVIAGGPTQTDHSLNGTIDEVRISNRPRNQSWIRASYLNQREPSLFYSIGVRENL